MFPLTVFCLADFIFSTAAKWADMIGCFCTTFPKIGLLWADIHSQVIFCQSRSSSITPRSSSITQRSSSITQRSSSITPRSSSISARSSSIFHLHQVILVVVSSATIWEFRFLIVLYTCSDFDFPTFVHFCERFFDH